MADTPGGWMSFGDYLGLNEASLADLEAQAMERTQAADAEAMNALQRSYQQADTDAGAGGQKDISETTSYLDYVKAKRTADESRLRLGPQSSYEAQARGAMGAGAARPDFSKAQSQFQGRVTQRRDETTAARTAQDLYAIRKAAEAKAQQDAYDKARKTTGTDSAAGADYARYSDAVGNSYAGARAGGLRRVSDTERNRR